MVNMGKRFFIKKWAKNKAPPIKAYIKTFQTNPLNNFDMNYIKSYIYQS